LIEANVTAKVAAQRLSTL